MSTEATQVEATASQAAAPTIDMQAEHLRSLGYTGPSTPPPDEKSQPDATPAATTAPPAVAEPEAPKTGKFASFVKPQEGPPAWTDEAKALLKARGVEDPDAHFNEFSTLREQLSLLKKKDEDSAEIISKINSLNPVYQEFIKKGANGEDALAWVRSLPKTDLAKEAAKLDKVDLVEEYCGKDAFTKEEYAMLRNPDDYDADEVAQLQKRLGPWAKIAAPLHETARKSIVEAAQQEEAARAQRIESINKGIAANSAYVKEKRPEFLASMTSEKLAEFASGAKFNKRFFEADGITPKPSAYADLETLENLDEILRDVREAALEEGRSEAMARSGTRNPTTAQGGAATRGNQQVTPAEQQQLDHLRSLGYGQS